MILSPGERFVKQQATRRLAKIRRCRYTETMAIPPPAPLTANQRGARLERIMRIAERLGFVGIVEYRHVYSKSGGAQYGRARSPDEDLLIVYAEAFDKDADPDEFSLTAILAHERGHQILARHARIAARVLGRISDAGEEILASVLGSLICQEQADRDNLAAKAIAALIDHGEVPEIAVMRIEDLQKLFGELL